MIETFAFHATEPGPQVLVFGAVHGHEICGTMAIRQVMEDLWDGKVVLQKGSVTFVPVANPLAHAKGVRYVKENLNRIFRPTRAPKSDEARFANILCRLVDQCDVFLDVHSITAQGEPFIYLDYPTARNRALARVLGPDLAIVGWPELYKKFGAAHQSFDTPRYAASKGKDCLLIECGQHEDKDAPRVAHAAILNMLRHYGVIKGSVKKNRLAEVRMKDGFFREHAKDRLARDWKHLDPVKKGEVLIVKHDGAVIKAPYDALVVMPKASAPVGDDWVYLGKAS
jgi:uncharacterized protein